MDLALNALQKIPYFAEIEEPLQQTLAQYAYQITVGAGQVVFVEGDESEGVYIVESGWLKSSKSSLNGREHVLQFIGTGETFNEVSVLIEVTNPTTVTALEHSVLWIIRRDRVLDVLDHNPKLARIIVQKLAGKVQFLFNMVEDLSLRSIEARLSRYLLDQAKHDTLHRPRWATQAELANHLGTVPNVLHRALKILEQEDLITVERHQIKILNMDGLIDRAALDK